jgi:hypothetical protein
MPVGVAVDRAVAAAAAEHATGVRDPDVFSIGLTAAVG